MFGNLSGEAFHSNVIVILMRTAVDGWSLNHLYDVSLISVQVFRIRARPMSSCTVLELYHCASLKRTVQNSGRGRRPLYWSVRSNLV